MVMQGLRTTKEVETRDFQQREGKSLVWGSNQKRQEIYGGHMAGNEQESETKK